ncbi:XrtX-associated membrane protein [Hymenobacter psoromatis]|uniref:XrtX-associated membrane protein n=1 Tax=Hymenobacter psoromatis TaxID=1484116 RepID=UPI001CBA9F80|nr:hypothetical protein [Hymenobacter psoromatis]
MRPLPPAPAVAPLTPARWALVGLLVGGLFVAGTETEAVFGWLTRAWQAVFSALGLGGALTHWQQATSHLVTTRSLPAVVSYSLLYVVACVLLLHLLLRNARRTRWVVQVYLGLLGLYALLLLLGRVGGTIPWALKLSRRIIDFLVSPLPVMLLLPLLWPGLRRPGR